MRREQFFEVLDGQVQQSARTVHGKVTLLQGQSDNLDERGRENREGADFSPVLRPLLCSADSGSSARPRRRIGMFGRHRVPSQDMEQLVGEIEMPATGEFVAVVSQDMV